MTSFINNNLLLDCIKNMIQYENILSLNKHMTILYWKVWSNKNSKQFWRRFLFLFFFKFKLHSLSIYKWTYFWGTALPSIGPPEFTVRFGLNVNKQHCRKDAILYLYFDFRCWGQPGALVAISPFCCFCCESYIRKWLLFLLCLLSYGMWDDSQRRRNCGRAGPIKRLGSYLVLTKYGFLTFQSQPVAFTSTVRANLPPVS